MNESRLEAFLARIYVDRAARGKFLADRRGEAMKAGLSPEEVEALVNIDGDGLELFARSLEHKRSRKEAHGDGHSKNQYPKRASTRWSLFASHCLQRFGLRRRTALD
jgi:hypothetical protein